MITMTRLFDRQLIKAPTPRAWTPREVAWVGAQHPALVVSLNGTRDAPQLSALFPMAQKETLHLKGNHRNFVRRAEASDWAAFRTLNERDIYRQSVSYFDSIMKAHGLVVGSLVSRIQTAPAGTVLIHCDAGKDRSGLVVALAALAYGQPLAEVAATFELPNRRPIAAIRRIIGAAPPDVRELVRLTLASDFSALFTALTRPREPAKQHGTLIIICGLPGAGKSALATELRRRWGDSTIVLDNDHAVQAFAKGTASPELDYAAARRSLPTRLAALCCVAQAIIIDASLPDLEVWTRILAVATRQSMAIVVVQVPVDPPTAWLRIRDRRETVGDIHLSSHTSGSLGELNGHLTRVYGQAAPERLVLGAPGVSPQEAADLVEGVVLEA